MVRDAVEPFVRGALARLRRAPEAGLLRARAWAQLERDLRRQLAEIAGPSLERRWRDVPAWMRGLDRGWVRGRPGRLLRLACARWLEANRELLRRAGEPVLSIRPSLSDPHEGRRMVAMLELARGRLVYKPKDLRADAAWNEWLRGLGMRALEVRPVGRRYGWVERVESVPPRDPALYHERLGRLLALLRAAGATDAHRDNVMPAEGDWPVLIDAETLGQRLVEDSLLGTGLLPRWVRVGAARFEDLSGLGGGRARAHVEDVVRGYAAMRRALSSAKGRRGLRAFRSRLSRLTVRVVPRPTAFYVSVQRRLLLLDSAADRRRLLAPLKAAERRALEGLDVPRFEAKADARPRSLPDESGLIRACLTLGAERRPARAPARAQWSAARALAEAGRIAERLDRGELYGPRADLGPGGPLGYALAPLGASLYDGWAGVALFRAGLFRVDPAPEHRRAALAALRGLEYGDLGLGGGAGLGGVVYALARCAELLGEESLLREAEKAAAEITPARVARERERDAMLGLAGAALGLLALSRLKPRWRARAELCADRLRAPTGAGMAHGAAGAALALARLGRPYSFGDGVPPEGPMRGSWCAGVAGVALARLKTESKRLDRSTLSVLRGPAATDTLCCGLFGRLELLHEAGFTEEARERAAGALTRAEREGAFRLIPDVPGDLRSPGFHQGEAGIGWTLLRLARPGLLPCALSWD